MQRQRILFGCIFVVLTATLALAQTGSITGIVQDPTGAVVAGASVTATDQATGAVTKADSTGSGNYTLSNLPVGIYRVAFEKQGFKILQFDNVNVSVALALPLD